MSNYDISIIERISSGPIIGISYYTPDPVGEYNYYELDLYLLILQVQIRWR